MNRWPFDNNLRSQPGEAETPADQDVEGGAIVPVVLQPLRLIRRNLIDLPTDDVKTADRVDYPPDKHEPPAGRQIAVIANL